MSNEEASVYWQFGSGDTILMEILERGLHSLDYLSKTMLEVGWSFILEFMLCLEGLSSRSIYFIGVS